MFADDKCSALLSRGCEGLVALLHCAEAGPSVSHSLGSRVVGCVL